MNIALDRAATRGATSAASASAASPAPMHVLIIGGGIGGLTLAQGLKRCGISVAVFERDRTPTDRVQGYRVHINPAGSQALAACLPPHLFAAFERTCGKPSRGMSFLTERKRVLLSLSGGSLEGEGLARHRSVSRITLRQVLLCGLEDVVQFGKVCIGYDERPDGRVVAHFEDGSSAEGDVLVAADGGGSRVRRQFLPHAQRLDTGVDGIAGKIFLDGATRARIVPPLLDGMTLVSARGGVGLFVALQELDAQPGGDGGIGGNDAASPPAPGSHFDNTRSYLMWAVSTRREKLGTLGDRAAAQSHDAEHLRALALRAMDGWHEDFRDLVRLADAGTINLLTMRTSVPVEPWPSARITLVGDAIHSMTPFRGIGANIALKDAVRLRDALVAAQRGERPLLDAIHDYETEMRRYGFAAVHNSLAAMQQMMSEREFGRTASRAALRLINALPPLKRRFSQRLGNE
jgi:2-polyprenyl-6-methoxyphenol hydroxylase-like FAD-dependent oxidoreductase